ncbi:MAG: hypothetical protein K0R17_3193 [Rariglobus sp.]|nr:hypothetical protein [Rariglobus sp.]
MKTVSLVNEAEKRLRDWIKNQKMKPGQRLPAGRGFARDLGVGYYALNRALGLLVAEGVIERDGYKHSLSSVGSIEPLLVHLAIPRRANQIAGYRKVARALGIRLVVRPWMAEEELTAILDELTMRQASGLICVPPGSTAGEWLAAAARLTRRGVPVVIEGWVSEGVTSSVGVGMSHGAALAIEHLAGLGHRELALVTCAPAVTNNSEVLITWRGRCALAGLNSSVGRINFGMCSFRDPEDLRAMVELLTGAWRDVTGLVIQVTHDCAMDRFMQALARCSRPVPRSLSLVALGHAPGLARAFPSVTEVSVHPILVQQMCFDLLRLETTKLAGRALPPSLVQVLPHLTVRGSTAASGVAASAIREIKKDVHTGMPPDKNGAKALATALSQRYSLAARASLSEKSRFASIDLRPYVNRALNHQRGWLGDLPLRCLEPGMHEIHGVPFQVLGGPRRTDGGAIVFHSTMNVTGRSERLPDRLVIPIGERVEAVYILHGCGYARPWQTFANYRFASSDGTAGVVPLISLGQSRAQDDSRVSEKGGPQVNIQDWWSDFPHMDFPHARMVPLLEKDGSGTHRHAYLYTLEWINPSPGTRIEQIEICADSSVVTTLGVLAITVVTACA